MVSLPYFTHTQTNKRPLAFFFKTISFLGFFPFLKKKIKNKKRQKKEWRFVCLSLSLAASLPRRSLSLPSLLLLLHELIQKLIDQEPPLGRDLDRLRRFDVFSFFEPVPQHQPPDDVGPLVDLDAVSVVGVRGQVVEAQRARGRGLDEDFEEAYVFLSVVGGKERWVVEVEREKETPRGFFRLPSQLSRFFPRLTWPLLSPAATRATIVGRRLAVFS